MDETIVKQRAKSLRCSSQSIRRLAISSTRRLLHRGITSQLGDSSPKWSLYGRAPPIVVTDGASYGPVFNPLGITHIVRRHSVRNRIEHWIQELKRCIDTFHASFTGNDVVTTNDWFWQFAWVWNVCLS